MIMSPHVAIILPECRHDIVVISFSHYNNMGIICYDMVMISMMWPYDGIFAESDRQVSYNRTLPCVKTSHLGFLYCQYFQEVVRSYELPRLIDLKNVQEAFE